MARGESDWMVVRDDDDGYLEVNFLPDDPCPKQIRIWGRGDDGGVEVRVTIIRAESTKDSQSLPCCGSETGVHLIGCGSPDAHRIHRNDEET